MTNTISAIRVFRVAVAALTVISCSAEPGGGTSSGRSASNQSAEGPSPSRLEACGYYAESPAEPHSANGVAVQFIDLENAIPACRSAVERDSTNARELTRYARVLETQLVRGENAAVRHDMMEALNRATALDDPRAHLALARWLNVGAPGFPADPARAAQHEQSGMVGLRREATEGSPQAKVMLGHAMAASALADDRLISAQEHDLVRQAGILIEEGGAAGADRLIFDIHEGLKRSGFCDPTTPYDWRAGSSNERERHCLGLGTYLELRSRDPVVAYEYTVAMLNRVRHNIEIVERQALRKRRESDSIWRGVEEDIRRVMERFEYLAASDNQRVVAAARRFLPEVRNIHAQINNISLASVDARNSAALAAALVGVIELAGTARSARSVQSPSYWTPPEFECSYADNFGLVYTVPC